MVSPFLCQLWYLNNLFRSFTSRYESPGGSL
jgi:hypothetical protein